jgi:hypothetical protein
MENIVFANAQFFDSNERKIELKESELAVPFIGQPITSIDWIKLNTRTFVTVKKMVEVLKTDWNIETTERTIQRTGKKYDHCYVGKTMLVDYTKMIRKFAYKIKDKFYEGDRQDGVNK